MRRLEPQLTDEVEVLVRVGDKSAGLGEHRQRMLEEASGEYTCFVDDDDLVSEDYVSSILPLLDGVDYIGFQLQLYRGDYPGGVPEKPTEHSLRHKVWWDDDKGYYRDISHLNPIRRELALLAKMEGGTGEDARWADQLRNTGQVKTEHFIPKVMYHYYWRADKGE